MRLLDLARVVVDAERLRLTLYARRQGMRGISAVVAALFGLFVLIMLHIVALAFLAPWLGAGFAALSVTGVDLIVAGIFALLASRNQPGVAEAEAAALARVARSEIRATAAGFAVAAPVAKAAGGGLRGALLTTLITHLVRRRKKAP